MKDLLKKFVFTYLVFYCTPFERLSLLFLLLFQRLPLLQLHHHQAVDLEGTIFITE